MGLSELTPGPVSWNVEVFVQALKELVSAGKRDNDFICFFFWMNLGASVLSPLFGYYL